MNEKAVDDAWVLAACAVPWLAKNCTFWMYSQNMNRISVSCHNDIVHEVDAAFVLLDVALDIEEATEVAPRPFIPQEYE